MLAHFQSQIREDTGAESEKPLHKFSVQIRDMLAHFRSLSPGRKPYQNPGRKTTNPGRNCSKIRELSTQTRQISSLRRSGLREEALQDLGGGRRDRGQQQQQQRQRKTDGGGNNGCGNQLLCGGLLSFLPSLIRRRRRITESYGRTASASAQLQGKIFMWNRRVGRGLDNAFYDIAPATQTRRLGKLGTIFPSLFIQIFSGLYYT